MTRWRGVAVTVVTWNSGVQFRLGHDAASPHLRATGLRSSTSYGQSRLYGKNSKLEGGVIQSSAGFNGLALALAASATLALGGCDGPPATGGDPGAAALPAGETCGSIREQLNKLDRKGAQASVEAANAGRKLSASQRQDADDYNRLLGQYLGSRCHV